MKGLVERFNMKFIDKKLLYHAEKVLVSPAAIVAFTRGETFSLGEGTCAKGSFGKAAFGAGGG